MSVGNSPEMWVDAAALLGTLRPAPPANPPSGSLVLWIWVTVGVALLVAGAVVFTSRR